MAEKSIARKLLSTCFKGQTPTSILFILGLFKRKFQRKIECVSGIRTQLVGVDVEHAKHLITPRPFLIDFLSLNFFHSIRTRASIKEHLLTRFLEQHPGKSNKQVNANANLRWCSRFFFHFIYTRYSTHIYTLQSPTPFILTIDCVYFYMLA